MYSVTSQLIWRDYFYTMSIDNKNFGQMEDNPACISIPWNDITIPENKKMLECWKAGKTGYPFIDAGMRQLMQVPTFHSFWFFDVPTCIQISLFVSHHPHCLSRKDGFITWYEIHWHLS